MDELCRFCGSEYDQCIDLFDNHNLIENITSCFLLQLNHEDQLPKKICISCDTKLKQSIQFYNLIKITEQKFFNKLSHNLKIIPVANLQNNCLNTVTEITEKILKLPNLRIQKINNKTKTLVNNLDKDIINRNQVPNIIQKLQKKSKNLTISKIGKKNCIIKTDIDLKIEDIESLDGDIMEFEEYDDEDDDDDDDDDDGGIDDVAFYDNTENDLNNQKFQENIDNVENYEEIQLTDVNMINDKLNTDKIKKETTTPPTTRSSSKSSSIGKVILPKKNHTNTNQKSMKEKVLIVKMESPASYVCMTCKEKFPAFEPLKEHMKNNIKCKMVHLTCDVCSKICDSKKSLYQHSLTHKDKNTHICDECGKTYSNRFNLENHKSSFHGEQVEEFGSIYKCKVCDKQFTNRKELYTHINSHTKEATVHLCDSCGKCFTSLETLRSHIRIHLDIRPFCCENCDKRFRSRLQLQQHLHVHTGIKPYICNECGKTFAKKGSLISHTRSHTGETPYSCNICLEKFSSSSKLKTHTKSHLSENEEMN